MTLTYTIEDARPNEKCHECGGIATILLVGDSCEGDTGYVDEVPLCEDCAEKRSV